MEEVRDQGGLNGGPGIDFVDFVLGRRLIYIFVWYTWFNTEGSREVPYGKKLVQRTHLIYYRGCDDIPLQMWALLCPVQ